MVGLLRSALRKRGVDLRKHTPTSDPYVALANAAGRLGCDTVLDVGANAGQFARLLRGRGWRGGIVSFEPLPEAHARLTEIARSDPLWEVQPPMALGRTAGRGELNVSARSESSSLLPMLARHERGAPGSAYVANAPVEVRPLFAVIAPDRRYVLKMDVQGFESEVLAGAAPVLDAIPLVFTEMALQPLYAGEKSYVELSRELQDMGYVCIGIWPGYADLATGEMLQVDALFARDPGGA